MATEEQMKQARDYLEKRERMAEEKGTNPKRVYYTNPDRSRVFHWELTCLMCGKRFESILVEDTRCPECRQKPPIGYRTSEGGFVCTRCTGVLTEDGKRILVYEEVLAGTLKCVVCGRAIK